MCPICKLPGVINFIVNEPETHRFIECPKHVFIVSEKAERLLLKEIGYRIEAAGSFQRVSDNKILKIENESSELQYYAVPVPDWCKWKR